MINFGDFEVINNIGKMFKNDIHGKLILFKDNNQSHTMYAEIKQDSEYIYAKSSLTKYLEIINDGYYEDDIYGSSFMGNVKLCTIGRNKPIIYPFVFIPFNLLDVHKITGFVRLSSEVTIKATNYGDVLQDVKFVPVGKDGILCELSNEI